MLKLALASALVALTALSATVQADTFVNGYTRGNGTYVAPHYRSSPDSSFGNNWSTRGNVNPHTGELGTRDFYQPSPTYGRSLLDQQRSPLAQERTTLGTGLQIAPNW